MIGQNFKRGRERKKKSPPALESPEYAKEFLVRGIHHLSSPIPLQSFLPTIVETDASYYALGAVLSQVSDSGKHPIAFNSGKLIPAELNYEIHDKELLGILWALKRWRDFLLSLSSPFESFLIEGKTGIFLGETGE
ncbi:hypothetical protein O181_034946 [Austropuccinia psidii MF-1]|uniref:Reverse transcriptase/retrotransposon-derived protein RNase H-like domain-containing protein n=1 Tax=Austropuccinia psidii MF-1 TaxID=1389203 RepID=A0A9Q3D7D4_9BASI|nr:hypothetical protein [Austropuccinia psidii MF-1]